ncbi:riboflavin-specific deaminase [Suhomyces tanzawaensis NRRL Y-17324]|uniref:2,5-diamino-6-ribosylamino-4(3H)-pyrimidinone 5'-phosphate reductase n=1 Tax=Suhomyces tanzawaensis NRRL Y-17324 TaxID=984487 RepID=A0A1E4SFM6_9ASCO|nr:riboflavin-specific deaminase [Suhomyces tanzawaensis NRRL Y-17324]ODV78270.1 riboflavin-specific deaminase [Suhomyces tanzawaensis NRRL Y-17324]
MSLIPLPESLKPFLESYLPQKNQQDALRPFVTLTYAQSLDSRISSKPGQQTVISHLETKTMTHYLRSRYDGILVGIGTVLADDPKLNCRFTEDGNTFSPRPIVIDPKAQWDYTKSTLRKINESGKGLAPYILVDESVGPTESTILELAGGKLVRLPLLANRGDNWSLILKKLLELGVHSVMVEGGAKIINDLLVSSSLIDSIIITVGPVFLGNEGVEVSPSKHVNLTAVKWWTGVQDSVLCAFPKRLESTTAI